MRDEIGRSAGKALESIQVLRGFAASGVVLFHIGLFLERFGYDGPWPGGLAGGVDLFFVISGFIMVHAVAERSPGPGAFLRDRVRRIVPLYWAVTVFTALVLLVAPSVANSAVFDARLLLASILFWPAENAALGGAMMPLVVPGWTLNLEMFFYVVFAIGLVIPARGRLLFMAAVLTGFVGAGQIAAASGPFTFWGQPIVLEFVLGMMLAHIFRAGLVPRVPVWLPIAGGLALVLLGSVPGAQDGWMRLGLRGVPAVVIVGAALSVEATRAVRYPRIARRLGDASYSLYLVHGIVLSAYATLWVRAGLPSSLGSLNLPAFAVSAAVVAGVAGIALWRRVEYPADRALRGLGRSAAPGRAL